MLLLVSYANRIEFFLGDISHSHHHAYPKVMTHQNASPKTDEKVRSLDNESTECRGRRTHPTEGLMARFNSSAYLIDSLSSIVP